VSQHTDAHGPEGAQGGSAGTPRRSRLRQAAKLRPLLGSTLAVTAVTAFARLNGGVREVLIAREFGTARSLETFLVAFAIVSVAIDAVVGGLPSSLIPTFHRRRGGDRMPKVLGAVLPGLAAVAVGLAVAMALAAPVLAKVVAGGFGGSDQHRVQGVIVILAPTIAFGLAATVASSCLQEQGRFVFATLPSVANPLAAIAVLLLTEEPRSTTLAWAFCAGYAAELVVAASLAALRGVRVSFPGRSELDAARSDRRLFFRELWSIAIGLLALSSMTVSDQAVATHLDDGDVAILNFGIRIPGFLSAVGVTAIGMVVLPQFSRLVGERDWATLRASMRTKARLVFGATALGALVLSVASVPIVDLVFGRGAFTDADVADAAAVQVVAAWMVPFSVLGVVYARLLSARHRNRAIMVVSLGVAVLNLVFDLVLGPWLGAPGLALSTTLASATMCIVFGTLARWSIPSPTVVPA